MANQPSPPSSKYKMALLGLIWVLLAMAPVIPAVDYYVMDLPDRAYSADHELMKPSGLVGHGLGILGSAMMIFGVATYSLRKRSSFLARFGKLSSWLTFHIFLCTLGPFYVTLHTTFRFGGIVSISFWSMVAVVVSGLFGRYVYARIPKSLNGVFKDATSLLSQQQAQLDKLREAYGDSAFLSELEATLLIQNRDGLQMSIPAAVAASIRTPFERRGYRSRVEARTRKLPTGAPMRDALLEQSIRCWNLNRQLLLLKPFQRAFGYWHVFHLPLAIIMFLILFIHVGIAIAFGYGWIF
ncbi:MAG: hypothetical protein HKN43_02295 [Rhodothermales bacterium]|nr:hypothetical protein [Rhodothermales bacterium]